MYVGYVRLVRPDEYAQPTSALKIVGNLKECHPFRSQCHSLDFQAVRHKPKDSVAVGFQQFFLGLYDTTFPPRRPVKIMDLQDFHEIIKQRDTF
jgi:hypothetical protein